MQPNSAQEPADLQGSPDRPMHDINSLTSEFRGFDADHYRLRMSKFLDQARADNEVFYEALAFAHELHAGQKRKSGAPYISHPCAVAEIIARELQVRDPLLLVAALLHDVVEDIPTVRIEDIEMRFGPTVAELVDGCTKLTRYHLDRAAIRDLTHSKIFLSASRRLGVLIIKLADRLHNLRTLHYLPQAKRQRIAHETVEVYAPIAARLNLFPLKRELYHLALSFLYPKKSKKILQFIRTLRGSPAVAEVEETVHRLFAQDGPPVTVRLRAKGLGSYYDPLKKTLELSNAENHIDFAIILDSSEILQCYRALGMVSLTFPPIPRNLRDFIANPKHNGYRSLHVRVHVGGHNYLMKIRTPEMDRYALYGILTAWDASKPLSDEHWQEISELLRTIGEYAGAAPQRKALIRLSESEETFVYSPKGDIYYLPKGSLVLDFAYKIHSDLGDRCNGALVNNEWAPPTHLLKDGDIIRVFTAAQTPDVDPDLEAHCKTPKARSAVNRRLQQRRLQYAREIGRQILVQEFARRGAAMDVLEAETASNLLEFLNLRDLTELFVRVGQDLLSPHLVLYYLAGAPAEGKDRAGVELETVEAERNTVVVPELDRAIHKFARCCNPYPGQEGVVATLSERGVTFHHQDCRDLVDRHDLPPQKLVAIRWEEERLWRTPLIFRLTVHQCAMGEILRQLSRDFRDAELLAMQVARDRNDQPLVRITALFRSFGASKELFGSLPLDRTTVDSYEAAAVAYATRSE